MSGYDAQTQPINEDEPLIEKKNAPSPYLICLPIFIYLLNVSIFLGVQQQWLITYLCNPTGQPDFSHRSWEQCRGDSSVQASAAQWGIILQLSSGIPSLFLGPIYGFLSDRIGRKFVILLSMTSSLVSLFSYTIVTFFGTGLWVLILAQLIAGLFGGVMIVLPGTFAYFADVTPPEKRGRVFVVGESCFFGAFALGPFIGGYIARNLTNGIEVIFGSCVIAQAIIIITTILFLPESLRKPKEVKSIADSISKIKSIFIIKSSKTFVCLLLTACILPIAYLSKIVFFFYTSYKFHWDSQDEGQFNLVSSIAKMLTMVILFPVIRTYFRSFRSTSIGSANFDLYLIRGSLGLLALSQLLIAFAQSTVSLYIFTCIEALGAVASPILRSLFSAMVKDGDQGILFSGIAFVEHLSAMAFGIIVPAVWASTVSTQPNAFLLLVSCFVGVGCLFALVPSAQDVIASRLVCTENSPEDPDLAE